MNEKFLRISSGIPGLDEMMEGGFPFPSTILVAGGAGTGKTTFALQFLFDGAKKGEKGLYFTTLSEPTQWLLRFASRFSFVKKECLEKDVKCVELGLVLQEPKDIINKIIPLMEKNIADFMPKRIVIDPITVVGNMIGKDYRKFLFNLTTRLKNWQAVTLLTGEVMPSEPYPLEVAYIADGVILLSNIEEDKRRRRYLEVLKMRGTAHITGKHLSDIDSDGVIITPGMK
jgi:circadian clock protein KaiC